MLATVTLLVGNSVEEHGFLRCTHVIIPRSTVIDAPNFYA
jgi:hypothetical protein